ncbi:MAG TPA: hypothetical protein VGC66_24540 [Pyrinomonadaceae bacterium]|jgi:hypothetical protein
MSKTSLILLLLIMLLTAACVQKESDWNFPTEGMKTEQVEGKIWYDIGAGLLARHSKPEDDSSDVIVAMGAFTGVSPEKIKELGGETHALSLICDVIFERVCKKGENPPYDLINGRVLNDGKYVKEYRTQSGKTANVVIGEDRKFAVVYLKP